MSVKKLLGVLLLLTFAAIPAAFAVLPQNMGGADIAADGQKSQFFDDLTHGAALWSISNGSLIGGSIVSDGGGGMEIKLRDTDYKILNGKYRVKFTVNESSGGFVGFYFRGTEKGSFAFLFRDKQLSYMMPGIGETYCASFETKTDTEYEALFVINRDTAMVSIRTAGDAQYTKIGEVSGLPNEKGYFSMNSFQPKETISEIEIWNDDRAALKINEKSLFITVNAPRKLDVSNTAGQGLIWESSAPDVVEVDAEGNLNGLKAGFSVISVTTADGKIMDSTRVNVYIPVQAINFHKTEIKYMEVGEKYMLYSLFEPSNASNPTFTWVNGNPDIVELLGNDNRLQTLRALKEGEATIYLSLADLPERIATCKISVYPYTVPETDVAEFSISGESHKIPDDQFGVHYAEAMVFGAEMRKIDIDKEIVEGGKIAAQVVKDIGFQHIRGYWSWWDWKTGTRFEKEGGPGPNTTSLKMIYDVSEAAGAAQILNFSTRSSVDEMVEEFAEAKKLSAHPMYVEYGNETYATGHELISIPTVEVYVERLRELAPRLRAIDPNVKIGVPWLSYNLERAIFNDPNNFPKEHEDWEYTQGIRALTWNAVLSENAEYFDAAVPHLYSSPSWIHSNQFKALSDCASGFIFDLIGTLRQTKQISGKEIWFTEYSEFPYALYSGGVHRQHHQSSKSLGAALSASTMMMQSLDSPLIGKTSFHYLIDLQGFGVYQPDKDGNPVYLPQYYQFGEIGKLLSEYEYYYGVKLEDGKVEYLDTGGSLNQETQYFNFQHVYAWGLGDKDGIKKIAFMNYVKNPATVSVGNMRLKPERRYWSEDPYPDYIWNEKFYTAAPDNIPLPEELTNQVFSDTITLKPFSFTVVEVSGDGASRLLPSVKEKLTDGAVMRVGENHAFNGTGRQKIDQFDGGIAPVKEGEDIYVPLRSLAEIFQNYLKDIGDEDGVDIEILQYRDQRFEKEQEEIDISKVVSVETGLELVDSFYFNTRFKIGYGDAPPALSATVRDIPAELTGVDVPRVINGRTYVSAKLAGEIFDRDVSYYKDGIVVFTKNKTGLTENEIDSMLDEFAR
jgi:hypothetical protein